MTEKKMTLKQFWEELDGLGRVLKKSARDWFLYSRNRNVKCDDRYCPITAVTKKKTNRFYEKSSWESAAREIGLPILIGEKIVDAVDNRINKDLRYENKLKKALGIK